MADKFFPGQTDYINQLNILDAAITGGLLNIVEDLTPQLGGNLDINGFDIAGFATDAEVAVKLTNVVEDLTPQLGGNLDINGFDIAGFATDAEVAVKLTNVVEDLTPQAGGNFSMNGSQMQFTKGADVASATALAVLTDGNYFDVTGVIAITSINTTAVGTIIKLHFDSALVLTHNAVSLILPGNASITTAVGDEAEFVEYAIGNYRCTVYTKSDGTSVVGGGGGIANVVEDLTPQLGGNLDINGFDIAGFATDAELITNKENIGLNALAMATNFGPSVLGMVNGIADAYEDQTGIDNARNVLANYNVDKYTTLSTPPWDLLKLINFEGSFSVNAQDTAPLGVFFKPDGLKMYVVGAAGIDINQYTLTTAWDVLGTVTFNGSFSVAIQDLILTSVFFKTDGTKMYVLGSTNDSVYQYTLTTPWDVLGTVTFNGSFSVTTQETIPEGIFFKSDGLKMYVIGRVSDSVHQYTLTTAWDILGVVTFNGSFSVSTQDNSPRGLFFKSDGLKMYVTGIASRSVIQYTLSVAWDILSAITLDGSFSVATQEANPSGLFLKSDGTKLYLAGDTGNDISQYALGPINNMVLISRDQAALIQPNSASIVIDQTELETLTLNTDITAWASREGFLLTSLLSVDDTFNKTSHGLSDTDRVIVNTIGTYPINFNGNTVYHVVSSTANSFKLSLTSGGAAVALTANSVDQYDIATNPPIFSGSFSVSAQDTSPRGLFFSTDGTKAFFVGTANDNVYQYTLTTPWDVLGTVTFNGSFTVAAEDSLVQGLFFKSDGLKMYTAGGANGAIYQYTLTTAWDITGTVTFDGSFSVTVQDTDPEGVFFKSDGTKMYVVGNTNDSIFQYTLTTPWDITGTVTFNGSFSVAGQETSSKSVFFKSDGLKMYVAGSTGSDISQYTLTTAWDILGVVTFNGSFSVVTQDTSPQGLFFSADGTNMYTISFTSVNINQYALLTTSVKQVNQATLTEKAVIGSSRILTGAADLSTQNAGSSMSYTIITDNLKKIDVNGAVITWS